MKQRQKQHLEIGEIVNTQGLKGAVKVLPWCDDPTLLCALETLYLGETKKPVQISGARVQKNCVILYISGVDTLEAAAQLRGQILYLNRDDVELEAGTYFIQDLIGLNVIDAETGVCYGTLTDVLETGANDVYEVRGTGKPLLLPAIPDVVKEIDLETGVMRVRLLEGLLDAL